MKGQVTVNITNNERIFIDPETGQQLTPEQFALRYKMGGLGMDRITVSPRESD